MLKQLILLSIAGSLLSGFSTKPADAAGIDYKYIIDSESQYIATLVGRSGAIILGDSLIYTFNGSPHYYQISPYAANFAARALLDKPTIPNIAIVKNWMKWVFRHINSDGSIYDYYVNVDSLDSGVEYTAKKFDSQDSYAATFLTLARKYVEAVPADTSWLRGYSNQLESIGNAISACVADSNHPYGPDNYDGLTVAMPFYTAKYTMDNSEVNEGLRDMVWLEQRIITNNDVSYFQDLLSNQDRGFANLWDSTSSAYFDAEGDTGTNWGVFYPYAVCNLYPIWCGVIPPSSPRALGLWSSFNAHFPKWQNGVWYADYPWTIVCYAAAVMGDTSRVNSYLAYIQNLLETGKNPPRWYAIEAAFTLRAANSIEKLTDVREGGKLLIPTSCELSNNYPNPFNPSTTIKAGISYAGVMSLRIYNVLGQLVKVVDEGYKPAGNYSYNVNMDNFAGGVYFYTLREGASAITKKMLLLK
jgi:hypothetical protein